VSADLLNLPSNTVVGRLASSNGGSESIPFATLSVALGIGGSNFFLASNIAGTNTITGTTPLAAALLNAQVVFFVPSNTNTGATTFNRDGLGAVNVFCNNAALIGGEIQAGIPIMLYYDGVVYHILEALATADGQVVIVHSSDITKKLKFDLSAITTGTTRTQSVQDVNDTFVYKTTPDLLTNKTTTTQTAGDNSTKLASTAYVDRGSSGASLVFIQSKTASASASIDFTSGIDSTYNDYLVKMTDVIPASNAADLTLRVSQDGGGTFKAGATDYRYALASCDETGTITGTGAITTAIIVGNAILNTVNTTFYGEVKFSNPAGTTRNKNFVTESGYVKSDGQLYSNRGAGLFILNTAAFNAIRFIMSGGAITSGTFALYGIRKA
jgi:hypothetical protein